MTGRPSCPSSSPSGRSSDGTNRAGAGAARSSSSATASPEMAPPDGPRRGAGEPERVDIPAALAALAVRLDEARGLLGMDRLLERRTELEKAASEPGLWDDADHARQVTTELGRVNEDIDHFNDLAERLSDAQTLNELIEEEQDESLRPE